MIWRTNETIICLGNSSYDQYWERNLSFTFYDEGKGELHCTIFGKSDAAIAETATFVWSLKHTGGTSLKIYTEDADDEDNFDVSALQPSQMANILEANPTRELELQTGVWNEEQSTVLASCPLPILLRISDPYEEGGGGFAFTDEGTAFVIALEKRQTSFGSLEIACNKCKPIRCSNLQRILNLDVFDKLQMPCLDKELALIPFSTKVKTLSYTIDAKHVALKDVDSLEIVATDLCLKIRVHLDVDTEEWEAVLVSFLNRVAGLGHFERLTIALHDYGVGDDESENDMDATPVVAQALVGAIRGNPKLSHLNVSQTVFRWTPHIDDIFGAMEDHEGLRTLIVGYYPRRNDRLYDLDEDGDSLDSISNDYSALERLLSRNQHITVLDCLDQKITNGTTIEKLYALNLFFNGSEMLIGQESAELRPLLFTTALTECSVKRRFPCTAILLSHHEDLLCDCIRGVNVESGA